MLAPRSFVHQFAAWAFPSLFLSQEDQNVFKTIAEKIPFLLQEFGYMHLQATKPDTIGKDILKVNFLYCIVDHPMSCIC